MPVLSITLTAAQAMRVRTAAAVVGYPATDAGVQQWVIDWMKDTVRALEKREAEKLVAAPADF